MIKSLLTSNENLFTTVRKHKVRVITKKYKLFKYCRFKIYDVSKCRLLEKMIKAIK